MEIKKNKQVQWIDIERPNGKDLVWLEEKFKLHPVIVDELREPSVRAYAEEYKDYLYFIYYFPAYDTEDGASVRTEIDFIVTKDTVATVHYEPLSKALHDFEVTNEKNSLELMYHIVDKLIRFEERQLRHIREKVERIGREIFKDNEREILQKLIVVKRDVSEYRIVVRLQEPLFRSLAAKGKKFWGKDAEVYLSDLMGEHLKIVNQLEDYREAIADFEDTNNQLMNVKINNAMKTFTALSFLTFPFMLIAALFSMKTHDTPLVDQPYAFWIIVTAMAAGMISLAAYFKQKKWF
jgi:magnesium transporter